MRTTAIYRLPFVEKNELLTGQIERTRFTAIDRQLEALFTFLGDGVISGWTLEVDPSDNTKIILKKGSGVISSIAAATTSDISIDDLTSNSKNFIYAKLLGSTAYTAQADFLSSIVQFDSDVYLCLGVVNTNSRNVITSITDEGRVELNLIRQISSLVSQHVHTGAPGEPSKIDLFNHVKGVLAAANIEDLPASKITSGIIDRNRFEISHSDLKDAGTLSHSELDSLVENLQKINKTLFGDVMTANLSQLLLSMKHVWEGVDEYMVNFISVIPGIDNNKLLSNNSFIDINATNAPIDYDNHNIRGRFINSQELGQVSINSRFEWESGSYDSNFVQILDTSIAYGYGYGYGQGLDYFNVLETNAGSFFEGTTALTGFIGSGIGYGVSDPSGLYNFESWHPSVHPFDIEVFPYAYGYGWEYATGFPTTLQSTIVTLKPLSANLVIHDKNLDDYLNNVGLTGTFYDPASSSSGANLLNFLIQASNNSDLNGRRSNFLNTSNSQSSDLYSFLSYKTVVGTSEGYITSDISMAYIVWDEPYDMTIDNYFYFKLEQTLNPSHNKTTYSGQFDSDWTFDHSMNLIVEMEYDGWRHLYRYIGNGGGPTTRFIDRTINYFASNLRFSDASSSNPATSVISAQIVDNSLSDGNLDHLGSYKIQTSLITEDNISSVDTGQTPSFADLRKNITGFYLVAQNESGTHRYQRQQEYGPIIFPQGKREEMDQISIYGEELSSSVLNQKMLADISQVYISGAVGYSDNPDRNKIQNLTITFPDPVDFNSISWVSDEPSDSIVYIQIKKDDISSSVDPDYRSSPIYTNSDAELIDRDIFSSSTVYRSSGESFPIDFKSTKRIKMRVVLLPTSDNKVAPVINSITVNYTSKTASGSFTVDTFDQWTNAMEETNLQLTSDGKVKIQDINRTKNIIYGSEGKIVEYKASSSNWSEKEKIYVGDNLPTTVVQQLNGVSPRISGYVTDLKIKESGELVFLDRDSNRIIWLDMNYQPIKIIASEYAYDDNYEDIPSSKKATLVKAIYNRQLGDNGVLYLVFSHELDAWKNGVITIAGADKNVSPNRFAIRQGGVSYTLEDLEDPIICDRGILCFLLNSTLSNVIESISNPIIDTDFDPVEISDGVYNAGTDSCVKFISKEDEMVVDEDSRIEVSINKIGISSIYQNTYNLIYAPIQGVVAFDVDSSDNLYLLKKTRPYSWDTGDFTPENWYVKLYTDRYYSTSRVQESDDNFPTTSISFVADEPIFFLNSIFGYKGSIQVIDDFILISIPGFKKDGVFVFKKTSTSGTILYDLPTSITLSNDGTFPMGARFDPKTYSSSAYGDIYIALSDLKSSVSGSGSTSRVIKVSNDGTVVDWQWGKNDSTISDTLISDIGFAATINDVRPLNDLDGETDDGVIVST